METRLASGAGDLVLVTGKDVARDALRFGSRHDAEHFLRRLIKDPTDRDVLRRLATRELGASVVSRPLWDTAILGQMAALLVNGRVKIVHWRKDTPLAPNTNNKGGGGAVPRPKPVDPDPYIPTRPQPNDDPPPAPVVPEKRYWVEIELVDDDKKPIPNTAYEIVLPDKTRKTGRLDKDGFARIDGIRDMGSCKVSFPELDDDIWQQIDTLPERDA